MEFKTFPKWANTIRPLIAVNVLGGLLYAVVFAYYGGNPKTTNVGYAPVQPVPYSHAMHAGELGMDCLYCHTTVDRAAFAAIPPTETCMNCHARLRTESPKLAPVRESWETGMPVQWVKVHDLPDYVYFNHSAHVTRGVACISCHGRIDQMEVVQTVQPLSMGWCLECHRNPDPNLRPKEFVTKMDWTPEEDPAVLGARLRAENHINPSTSCSTCHR
ncbi:MAG: cytochrome c family protein [Candidatus Methylomirabilis sp.]|nr:cytochrome c family protein [Deltaproteobacteria bacterium]